MPLSIRSLSFVLVSLFWATVFGMSRTQSSRWFSILSRPITQPATIAIDKPSPRYSSAIFQPNMPNSKVNATSLTIGAEIRNEKVTPSGTPACTKPINNGTAEQEQNGVTMPRDAAITLATPSGRPAGGARGRAGGGGEGAGPGAN